MERYHAMVKLGLVGLDFKKRHYYKDLGGRKHTVEEVYLVER